MFGPDWDAACPVCTEFTSQLGDAFIARLWSRDTAYAMVCRAPMDRIEAYRAGTGLDGALVLLLRQRLQLRLPGHAG